jgi:hypothetical protein
MRSKPNAGDEAARLRRQVEKLGPRGPGERFPESLKRELCAAAAAIRDEGASWREVGLALGLRMETARRFAESVVSMGARIRAVEIVEAEPNDEPGHTLIRIVSPLGLVDRSRESSRGDRAASGARMIGSTRSVRVFAFSARIPEGLGHIIFPDGTIRAAQWASIFFRSDGTMASASPK